MTQQNTYEDGGLLSGDQVSNHIENLEARNITLKQKEEDNKLSFAKNRGRL